MLYGFTKIQNIRIRKIFIVHKIVEDIKKDIKKTQFNLN